MRQKITNLLKYNTKIYNIYFVTFSFIINILKKIVIKDDKLILFNSFGGRKYNDSPKEIFEAMKVDPRFNECKFVWAFHEPDKFKVEGAKKIKTNSMLYFKTALKARVWVTNSSVERGLDFIGKHTFYFNTWHGTPIKKMGEDIVSGNTSFVGKAGFRCDVMMSQGHFETEVFSRAFKIPKQNFLEVGLPRNDILASYSQMKRMTLRKKIGIDKNQIVILYCPTFREYKKDSNLGVVMAPPMNLKKWREELGEEYVLLIRAHYEVSKVMEIQENRFVKNMSEYLDINELYIIADILISDYSSCFFDYSITGKPMLHFAYDFDEYISKRGMYFDIRKYISGGATEDELIRQIKTMNYEKEKSKARNFRDKYVNYFGHATKAAVDCIASRVLSEPDDY